MDQKIISILFFLSIIVGRRLEIHICFLESWTWFFVTKCNLSDYDHSVILFAESLILISELVPCTYIVNNRSMVAATSGPTLAHGKCLQWSTGGCHRFSWWATGCQTEVCYLGNWHLQTLADKYTIFFSLRRSWVCRIVNWHIKCYDKLHSKGPRTT